MDTRTIATQTHGRYLVDVPSTVGPAPLLIGFHGYAEAAEQSLARLSSSDETARWLRVAVQALNRFYQRSTDTVIAGWMTRQDRELAIADNVAYVAAVVDAVSREWPVSNTIVYSGFSQGTSMGLRAAAAATRPVSGVIVVGGDIPPEIPDERLRRCGSMLICRGRADAWYTAEKFSADIDRLRRCGIEPRTVEFDGGHEWNAAVVRAVDEFLADVRR